MLNARTAIHGATVLMFPSRAGAVEGFTFADRVALQGWGRRAAALGYGRVLIEPGCPGGGPDRASYALVYRQGDPWSRWGLSRGSDGITVWCSVTGADHGTFHTMDAALASLE